MYYLTIQGLANRRICSESAAHIKPTQTRTKQKLTQIYVTAPRSTSPRHAITDALRSAAMPHGSLRPPPGPHAAAPPLPEPEVAAAEARIEQRITELGDALEETPEERERRDPRR